MRRVRSSAVAARPRGAVGLFRFIAKYIAAIGAAILFVFRSRSVAARQQRALKWIDSYGIQILIYVMLGWGLNIVVGLAGYWTSAMSRSTRSARIPTAPGDDVRLSFWICLPLAGILAALWGMILGFPCCACAATISRS